MRGHVKRKGRNWYVALEFDPIEKDGKLERVTKWISVRKELGLNKPATKKQADALLIAKLSELQRGVFVEPNDMTMAELLELWMETYAKANLRESTILARASYIKNHIVPAIGSIPVTKLKPLHLQKFYSSKLASGRADSKKGGLSPSTINDIHKTIRGALKSAIEWEIVVRNIAESVSPPKVERPELEVWTDDEAKKFLAHIKEHRLYPAYYLVMTTGMRRGEVLGLRWQDINWDQQLLSIRQMVTAPKGKPKISKMTKNDASRRSISLAVTEMEILKEHRRRQQEEMIAYGANWNRDLVFISEVGTIINPRNLLRHFQDNAKKIKLPVIPFHGLRHTSATLMLLLGVHPKVVAERLGHSRVGTTMDTYSHVLPNMQKEAAVALEGLLSPAEPSTQKEEHPAE